MEAQYDSFEIVRVIHGYKLVDSESYERRYWRRDSLPLPAGYYVVHWPEGVTVRRFNDEAVFYGAFRLRRDAQTVLQKMRAQAGRMGTSAALRAGRASDRPRSASRLESPDSLSV